MLWAGKSANAYGLTRGIVLKIDAAIERSLNVAAKFNQMKTIKDISIFDKSLANSRNVTTVCDVARRDGGSIYLCFWADQIVDETVHGGINPWHSVFPSGISDRENGAKPDHRYVVEALSWSISDIFQNRRSLPLAFLIADSAIRYESYAVGDNVGSVTYGFSFAGSNPLLSRVIGSVARSESYDYDENKFGPAEPIWGFVIGATLIVLGARLCCVTASHRGSILVLGTTTLIVGWLMVAHADVVQSVVFGLFSGGLPTPSHLMLTNRLGIGV
jgi:hypothetical protein